MGTFYVPGKNPEGISLKRLKELNKSISFCNTAYNDSLDENLKVPEEIKKAWREYSEAKKKFNMVLTKYDMRLD